VEFASNDLPCPPLTLDIEPSQSPGESSAARSIAAKFPAKPGVFSFHDANDQTITIFTTANLRRAIDIRLQPPPGDARVTRSVSYRELTHRIRACTVGSVFEADWAYLQLARKLLPNSYRAMLDRWQAWFIHCDPAAVHPQWMKTAHPNRIPGGVALGPFPDKHAAARYMDLMQDAFDLCRYHHILVQAPHAAACAYKEMGRCPAPCDGTVTLDQYRQQIEDSIAFGSTPIAHWREAIEQRMQIASSALDFENAQRLQRMLNATEPATRAEFAHINRLEHFRFIALAPVERSGKNWIRAFIIAGGWIEPVFDLKVDGSKLDFEDAARCLLERIETITSCFTESGLENIGLVCWHLFRPRTARPRIEFIRCTAQLSGSQLQSATRKLTRKSQEPGQSEITDQGFGEV
jgi:hypothetical protein